MRQKKNDIDLKRLKSKYAIEALFLEGAVVNTKHLLFRYAKQADGNHFYAGVSVSKRNFKKAVCRNRIKRQMREAIKANASAIAFSGNGMLVFKGSRQINTLDLIKETEILFKKING